MKTYTEEDLRDAFRAGVDFGAEHQQGSINALDEDDYIESLN